jgi:hypothetical protein
MKNAFLVETTIGMSAEVVSQSLQKVRWTAGAPQSVIVRKRGGERGYWHALLNRERNDAPPGGLRLHDGIMEIALKQQVWRRFVFVIDLTNALEKAGANNAAATPKARDLAKLQVPLKLFGRGRHLLVSLGIGDDLRGIERISYGVDISFGGLALDDRRVRKQPFGGSAMVTAAGERSCIDCLGDRGQRNAEIERGLRRPPARPLLLAFRKTAVVISIR